MNKTVFTSANILLPDYKYDSELWTAWSVIACDQFTSQKGYWDQAEAIAKNKLSTMSLVLPEAYLETEKENVQKKVIEGAMKSVPAQLTCHEDCLIFVERTLGDGTLRRGIVGKIDIDRYEFDGRKKASVCATEETVISRIPPRVDIRRRADIELPHVMVFYDDCEDKLMSYLEGVKAQAQVVYDFPLMLEGGHLKGYKLCGQMLCDFLALVEEYEAEKGDAAYAVGDGNHSLAAAKTYYEELKAELGEAAEEHPARYALCEMVNIYEKTIIFEPIYRILKNIDVDEFLSQLPSEGRKVAAYYGDTARKVFFPESHPLTVGCLQMYIDEYLKSHGQVTCDYIHGEDALLELAKAEDTIGFICEGIEKEKLLSYVAENGSLPRKTFSMGEATTKRYYNEARRIK